VFRLPDYLKGDGNCKEFNGSQVPSSTSVAQYTAQGEARSQRLINQRGKKEAGRRTGRWESRKQEQALQMSSNQSRRAGTHIPFLGFP
jgi:hypothetical protein